MHYVVELEDGGRWDVEVDPDDPERIRVNGVQLDLRIQLRDGVTVAEMPGGRSVSVSVGYEDGIIVAESPDGTRRKARVETADVHAWRTKTKGRTPPPQQERSGEVKAPIAGSVVEWLIAQDQEVREGDAILVIEAMKMKNTVCAPRNGYVHFSVEPGQVVRTGTLLANVSGSRGSG